MHAISLPRISSILTTCTLSLALVLALHTSASTSTHPLNPHLYLPLTPPASILPPAQNPIPGARLSYPDSHTIDIASPHIPGLLSNSTSPALSPSRTFFNPTSPQGPPTNAPCGWYPCPPRGVASAAGSTVDHGAASEFHAENGPRIAQAPSAFVGVDVSEGSSSFGLFGTALGDVLLTLWGYTSSGGRYGSEEDGQGVRSIPTQAPCWYPGRC